MWKSTHPCSFHNVLQAAAYRVKGPANNYLPGVFFTGRVIHILEKFKVGKKSGTMEKGNTFFWANVSFLPHFSHIIHFLSGFDHFMCHFAENLGRGIKPFLENSKGRG